MKKWIVMVMLGCSTSVMAWGAQPDEACKNIANQDMAQLQKQGIEQADRKAQYEVGQLYEHGCGVKKDLYQAYAWYEASWRYQDARIKAETLYDSFGSNQRKAWDIYQALHKKIAPYISKISAQHQKENAEEYLNLIDGSKAHSHPGEVVREFNASVKAAESGQ